MAVVVAVDIAVVDNAVDVVVVDDVVDNAIVVPVVDIVGNAFVAVVAGGGGG